jgi:hypothetical protein
VPAYKNGYFKNLLAASCNIIPFLSPVQPYSAAKIIALEPQAQPVHGCEQYTATTCGNIFRNGIRLTPVKVQGRSPLVRISINGRKSKLAIAKLVALTHVANPNNYTHYIHKDCDLTNCHANNLEWVSDTAYRCWKANRRFVSQGERLYSYEELLGPVKRRKQKPVIDLGGVPVNEFPGYYITKEAVVYKADRILAHMKGNRGCLRVKLRYPTEKKEYMRAGLATLVAEHFVPNPRKYKHVIFKDRDKLNCHADNLAWVDGETFMFWSGASKYQDGKHKKKTYTKEEALKRCVDPWLTRYYESGNETYIEELWKEIDKRFKDRNYKQWPLFRSECYIYLKERVQRYSLFHDPLPTLVLYMKSLREQLRKEISTPLPAHRLRQTDETLRNRNYRVGDTSGQWMWHGLE